MENESFFPRGYVGVPAETESEVDCLFTLLISSFLVIKNKTRANTAIKQTPSAPAPIIQGEPEELTVLLEGVVVAVNGGKKAVVVAGLARLGTGPTVLKSGVFPDIVSLSRLEVERQHKSSGEVLQKVSPSERLGKPIELVR